MRFQTPSFPDQSSIDRYFEKSRTAGWYSNFGPCVRAFEERVSQELLSGMSVVSASNATIALMVAMRAVFGEGRPYTRRVLVPSFTFIGSLSAITWLGFRPLFVDINADNWRIAEQALTDALAVSGEPVAGALLTTTFGTPMSDARRGFLETALADRGLPVVVDSAAGLGSCQPALLRGSVTVYSLHATKPFAVGEGAVLACPDTDVAERIRQLTNFGFDEDHALGSSIGINAKLSEIQAAIGLAVLDQFPETFAGRRRRALDLMDRVSSLGLKGQAGNAESSFQFLPVLCPTTEHRQRLLARALEAKVQLRTYFDPPMHRVAAFEADAISASLATTEDVASRIVSLPMSNDLSASDADSIVEVCRSVWE